MTERIILASQSPRRKEMLSWLELDFEVQNSGFDEDLIQADDVEELVEELALQKGLVIQKNNPESIIISADTMVSLGDVQIGKAKDKNHAFEILKTLSGSKHQITTGVAILDPLSDQPIIFHETTWVNCRDLTDEEIWQYLESDLWQDKAGAYAIQEDPLKLVTGYDGSYTNVMGLPLLRLAEELEALGIDISVDVREVVEAQTGKREI